MSKIHEIRSERAKINDRVQALAKLEAENGSLTAELQAQFEAMSGQIAHLESAARMNAAAAVPVSAATDVTATMTVPSQPKQPEAPGAGMAKTVVALVAAQGNRQAAAQLVLSAATASTLLLRSTL